MLCHSMDAEPRDVERRLDFACNYLLYLDILVWVESPPLVPSWELLWLSDLIQWISDSVTESQRNEEV